MTFIAKTTKMLNKMQKYYLETLLGSHERIFEDLKQREFMMILSSSVTATSCLKPVGKTIVLT